MFNKSIESMWSARQNEIIVRWASFFFKRENFFFDNNWLILFHRKKNNLEKNQKM